jgi:hypothetical protein
LRRMYVKYSNLHCATGLSNLRAGVWGEPPQ